MRCDQFAGLPAMALFFLEQHELQPEPRVCPTCNRPNLPERQVVGHYTGMFEDSYPLHRYKLKDGRTADEFLQASPWSSGPVHFIGLRISSGEEFLHSEEDIRGA